MAENVIDYGQRLLLLLRYALCRCYGGHDYLIHFTPSRIYLGCHCGKESPGWNEIGRML